MKANKFPGNVMKECGIKSWCQLGLITGGALILLLMGMTGWGFDWDGPLPGDGFFESAWNFLCLVVAAVGMVVVTVVGVVALGFGCRHVTVSGWRWARDNCEQINYEDDNDV